MSVENGDPVPIYANRIYEQAPPPANNSNLVKQVTSLRINLGDVISGQGEILQVVKFDHDSVIARELGGDVLRRIHGRDVEINLSQIGQKERVARQRRRLQYSWDEGTPIEVFSSKGFWCCGKITHKFYLVERKHFAHELWFQIVFYNHRLERLRYKQLKYDSEKVRAPSELRYSPFWLYVGITDQILSTNDIPVNLTPGTRRRSPANLRNLMYDYEFMDVEESLSRAPTDSFMMDII